jgi:demethylmenaquinone methyltransferase/2-methoxy-6-polyprenyl-1,4-benzoquinol methylase
MSLRAQAERGMGPADADGRRAVLARPHAAEVAPVKRQVVHELFATIAPGYDRFNRLASLGLDQRWRRQAVAIAGVRPGMRVLDVCSGTGDLALLCARALGGDGHVAGLDFTFEMLDGARRKQRAQGAAVGWLRADALAMPFPPAVFDRLFIGFSTRNLTNLQAGLTEMVRVLKPGGQLVILETGWPSQPLVRAAYLAFLGTVARVIGWMVTGRLWPFTYLARSVKAFISPSEFVALLARCGAPAQYRPLSGGLASLYIATKEAC